LAILNAGDRRLSAFVERSVPKPDGGWDVVRFNVFGAIAFSGIGELPPTQQDRAICVELQRATWDEIPEHLRDGISDELTLLRRQLATWAYDLGEHDMKLNPEMPEVLKRQAGRTGDNWRILAIANAAGGEWPKRAEAAALTGVSAEKRQSRIERLLISIKKVFNTPRPDPATGKDKNPEKLTTAELISALLADADEEWSAANRGRPITAYWSRDTLRHLLHPAGTKQWEDPKKDGARGGRCRGYLKSQFEDSWRRYTSANSSGSDHSQPSGVCGVSAELEKNSHMIRGKVTPVGVGIMLGDLGDGDLLAGVDLVPVRRVPS
jgi:hypothetical protein